MTASTEAQRLKALREAFGKRATQQLIADLAHVERVTINRAENGRIKWKSSELREGLMAAFGMSYEQLGAYLSGQMPLREAMLLAESTVGEALKRHDRVKARDELLEDVFRRASSSEPILQCTRDAMAEAYDDKGPTVPIAVMVRETLALNRELREHIEQTRRALRSDVCAPKR